MKTVTVRNAFTGITGNFQAVCQDGQVRVYDSVAGYWTTCHALTPSQIRRVKLLISSTNGPQGIPVSNTWE